LQIRIPDPDPGFDDLKLKKIYSWKFNFYFLDCKNCNLLIPRPPERTPKLQEKPSAVKREHPVLKNMNSGFFSIWWVIFALLDPDPDPTTQINGDPCGSGSETLLSGLSQTGGHTKSTNIILWASIKCSSHDIVPLSTVRDSNWQVCKSPSELLSQSS
jgi:hypothetical protein